MNKILKILSILVIGFVMFSCSTPTNDPTLYVPEPSGPETPVETPTEEETPETPTEDPIDSTPEVQTYSITFIVEDFRQQPVADLLNNSNRFKNLEEGKEVELLTTVYYLILEDNYTFDPTEIRAILKYEGDITSVVVGNEDIEIKVEVDCFEQVQNLNSLR